MAEWGVEERVLGGRGVSHILSCAPSLIVVFPPLAAPKRAPVGNPAGCGSCGVQAVSPNSNPPIDALIDKLASVMCVGARAWPPPLTPCALLGPRRFSGRFVSPNRSRLPRPRPCPSPSERSWSMQTNPVGGQDGWYSPTTDSGDKCAVADVGSRTLPDTGAKWNALLGGKRFYVRGNWLNFKGGACTLSGRRFNTGFKATPTVVDLKDHTVSCPPASALSLFRMQRNDNSNATLWHHCAPLNNTALLWVTAILKNTTSVSDQGGRLAALANLTVTCDKTQGVLSGWKVVVPGAGQVAIQYTCAQKESGTADGCGDKTTLATDFDPTSSADPASVLQWHEPACESGVRGGGTRGARGVGERGTPAVPPRKQLNPPSSSRPARPPNTPCAPLTQAPRAPTSGPSRCARPAASSGSTTRAARPDDEDNGRKT